MKIGQGNCHIFPVSVNSYINQVILSFFLIIAGKANPKSSGSVWQIGSFCLYIMGMDGLHTAHCLWKLFADNRMLMAVSNHKFKKLKQLFIFLKISPVQPGNLIVLTIRIIVSKLGISKLISRQKHGCSSAAHQNSAGIANHPVTKL